MATCIRRPLSTALAVATLLPLSGLLAQNQLTSPAGFENTDGASFLGDSALGTFSDSRMQQIDHTHALSGGFVIRELGLRQDAQRPSSTPVRTVDVEISMGLADSSRLRRYYDENYLPGSRQLVFTPKRVTLPAWNGRAGGQAPFDLRFPLDTPFAYPGGSSLVLDLTFRNTIVQGPTTPVTTADGVGGTRNHGPVSNLGGSNCRFPFRSAAMTFNLSITSSGPGGGAHGLQLSPRLENGPTWSSVILALDTRSVIRNVPGLCGQFGLAAPIALLIGATDASGSLPPVLLQFPHVGPNVGPLYAQAFVFEPTLPFGFAPSNYLRFSTPADPPTTLNDCALMHGPAPHGNCLYGPTPGQGGVFRLGL